jgi:hypothetical protein
MNDVLLWVSELFVMASFEVMNMAAVKNNKMASYDVRLVVRVFRRIVNPRFVIRCSERNVAAISSTVVSAIFFDFQ